MQVNTVSRTAAISPGSSDSLAAFAGVYATHLLPAENDQQVTQGAEIAIKVNNQGESLHVMIAAQSLGAQATRSRQTLTCLQCFLLSKCPQKPQTLNPNMNDAHCQLKIPEGTLESRPGLHGLACKDILQCKKEGFVLKSEEQVLQQKAKE